MGKHDQTNGPAHKSDRKSFTPEEVESFVQKAVETDEEGNLTFLSRLAKRMEQTKVDIPTITLEYQDLVVDANALVGSAANPSISNSALSAFKWLTRTNNRDRKEVNILKGISGVLKPGRMTLVLAPPGSGKSVFLNLLAGRMGALKGLRISGETKYNGVSPNEFVVERTAAHVEQLDNHLGSLTVHETLDYAYRFQTGAGPAWNAGEEISRNATGAVRHGDRTELMDVATGSAQKEELLSNMSDEEFDRFVKDIFGTPLKVDAVIKFLGLTRCQNTMAGDFMTRGISGGEKKRLTAAEMLVGPTSLLVMDEISTGLDAATLFSVIKWLKTATHVMRLTTVMSLVQPPPETFLEFDDLILLSEGKLVYHGPIPDAVPFFTSLGFQYPVRKDPASFLQEVTTPKGQNLYASHELRDTAIGRNPETELLLSLDSISTAYWATTVGKNMRSALANPFSREDGHPKALVKEKYSISLLQSTLELTSRQFKMSHRNKVLAKGRLMQVMIMGLLIGSLYYQMDNTIDAARQTFGYFFLSVMFMAMGSLVQLNITMMNKPVFYKHERNYFYPAMSYSWAMAFTQLPFSIAEATIFTATTYFLAGLSLDGAGYVFTFWLCIFTSSSAMSALFRFVACVTPSMVIANALGGLVLLMLVVNSGFTIVRDDIPNGWLWAYWISPFAHSVRMLAVNEFTSPRWQYAPEIPLPGESGDMDTAATQLMHSTGTIPETAGNLALKTLDFHTDRIWIWIGMGYLWGLYIFITIMGGFALKHLKYKGQQKVLVDEAALEKTKKEAAERIIELQAVQRMDVEANTTDFSIAQSLPVQPITLVFRNISYSVPATATSKAKSDDVNQLLLLKNITGYACPGVLTALMGGTGAGKTTLMDVIAGRKTQGTTDGELFVNGYPKEQKTWSRVVGYVEQFDVHSATATVREALEFSSRLRLDKSVSSQTMRTIVDEVLRIVDLTELQHSLVGTKGGFGLSLEQSKRLSIGVELVANPSVIFMDEPTSGLDAPAAATVMRAVKNISQLNRTIIVTIHQPSIEIFESFDNLLLLQLGGEMMYFGPLGVESCNLIQYFESIPGVAPIGPGHNPATWMLEVSGGTTRTMADAANADFVSFYKKHQISKDAWETSGLKVKEGKANHSPLALATRYAIPIRDQVPIIMRKFNRLYWRSPSYNFVRLLVTVATALVFGSLYWGQGNIKDSTDIGQVQNAMGVLFTGMSFMGMTNLITSLPIVAAEREVYFRERAASMYSSAPFAVVSGLVEVPYLFLQALLFTPIVFFMVQYDFTVEKFAIFFLLYLQSVALYTFFGQMLVYIVPIPALATVLGGAGHFLWTLFNGFMISESKIPSYWKWMNKATPTTYIMYGITASQFGDNDTKINAFGKAVPVKEYIEDLFGYEYSFRWWCVAILLLFIVVFRILTMVAMKTTKNKR